ncbi:hypothetical protein Leryth_014575 [Lithospermum erythrorhizon]|nr:hypothetical protein Leryth_014575 [Lithospermum erythrorhizon]
MQAAELKTLTPQPPTYRVELEYEPVVKDNRPLLKADSLPHSQVQMLTIEELDKKYPPFVRCDNYGILGCGKLKFKEKILLGLGICTVAKAPNIEEGEQEDYAHMGGWRRGVIVRTGRFLSRVVLFVMGFCWIRETRRESYADEQFNREKDQSGGPDRPAAIISNHVSYLDILYHTSSNFPSFVAKRSVGKLPLVGLISKCLGCVYVQREAKSSDFKGVSGVVNDRIREAQQNFDAPNMMLFPEGTTTNGNFLLPFKTGAFLAKAPVLPILLRFPYSRFSPAWETISGVRHIVFLLSQFVNYLEVIRLPIYYPTQLEKDDPKLYAYNVRRCMAHEGSLALSDLGLPEKRVYHAALLDLFLKQ